MTTQTRRERERAKRERLIVTAARELAEAEGWDAVTTRRLAAKIEYSQPVLYSHFSGKDAIMTAVAVEGFAELAAELRTARTSSTGPPLYDAMFTHTVNLPFATPEAPAALHEAFAELRETVRPLAGDDDPETLAETF